MPRRVLHVSTGLELGGAEALLIEAAAAAKKRGHELMVTALKSGGRNRERLEAIGVPVVELGASSAFPSPGAFVGLARVIARFRPDIIQSWMYHANIFTQALLLLRHRRLARRLIWGVYNTEMDLSRYSPRMRAVIRLGALWSGRPMAIVYNAEQARLDHERIGFRARQTLVIRNGVDTARFRPDAAARAAMRAELAIAPDAIVALMAARNDPQKDWPTALAGFARAKGVTAVAVGPGTERLPDQPGLIRLGPRMDMEALYAAADLFVLPSAFGEGVSVAMSEAMACGLPVIVTNVGDNARYAAQAGFVAPIGDSDALARQIMMLAADAGLRRRLGESARALALTEFDSGASYEALEQLHDRICASAA